MQAADSLEKPCGESIGFDVKHLITLGRAAKIAPGRPSANAVWRWARRGVLARNGHRVKLEHVRLGGRIFTTALWVKQFGERLAAADAVHFERGDSGAEHAVTRRDDDARREHLEQINRELDAAGL